MKYISSILLTVWYFVGIVYAKGFWQTTATILIPPYSFYLVVEKAVNKLEEQ